MVYRADKQILNVKKVGLYEQLTVKYSRVKCVISVCQS